jgi:hypothetical protein
MNTTLLRQTLLHASVSQLEEVINWLDRPWAPTKNDALRGAWHEARRSEGAQRALAYAIEEEVRALEQAPERDVAHVAKRLGLSLPTADAVAVEIARRLGGLPTVWPLPISPEVLASALRATADIARLVIGDGGRGRHGRHRRHRYGR